MLPLPTNTNKEWHKNSNPTTDVITYAKQEENLISTQKSNEHSTSTLPFENNDNLQVPAYGAHSHSQVLGTSSREIFSFNNKPN